MLDGANSTDDGDEAREGWWRSCKVSKESMQAPSSRVVLVVDRASAVEEDGDGDEERANSKGTEKVWEKKAHERLLPKRKG